tara:strand:- start:140 stop:973 length:834 start_codon:yes stop_codon:yes gene_type:complete
MFIYKQWDQFCRKLTRNGFVSIDINTIVSSNNSQNFISLKHDVETAPKRALKLAKIENKYGHKGTYYVQAYLLNNKKNINILSKIQELGHEVSYHHDVMDSNNGNISKADLEFERNVKIFEKNGFTVNTTCQHGNPVMKRIGYSSNRDFFRDSVISKKYSSITEVMVNLKRRINCNFTYVSDAGYGWKIIFDPENNDVIDSSDKDVLINDLEGLYENINTDKPIIISIHPHRWRSNYMTSILNYYLFKTIKFIAKQSIKIPFIKNILAKYYYLAKKI